MTDEQTAAGIMKFLHLHRWPSSMGEPYYNIGTDARETQAEAIKDRANVEAAIVRALAEVRMKATGQATQRTIDAAFREGYEAALDRNANAAVLRMCHEARMCNGIVDYSDPNATGVVRRVLGTLPVTADGCVAGHGAVVSFACDNYRMVLESQPANFTWNPNALVSWGGPDYGAERVSDCHSVREAAEAAKEEKQ